MATPTIRRATEHDVAAIVALLADDALGSGRESIAPAALEEYRRGFREIDASAANTLLVAELGGAVVGTLQLTIIPGMSRRGARRAEIEAVRVASTLRSRGIGEALVQHAIALAREAGCVSVQLITHVTRTDAHRFYDRLGFARSHLGMKMML
jgi:ribosomal protein S18 acetylase RimI-like enzyme